VGNTFEKQKFSWFFFSKKERPPSALALRHAAILFLIAGPFGWFFFYLIFRQTPGPV
jgi:hypothetical protein